MNRRDFVKKSTLGGLALSTFPAINIGNVEVCSNRKNAFPFRQIHLDFHTSRFIENVDGDFDPEKFIKELKKAHVNSVTCFGRCHHGYMYYNSKLYPERVHPHLVNKDLLKEQIQVCHKHGIRVPIYVTIQWDHYTAREHPEWLMTEPDGNPVGQGWFEDGFYRFLDVYSPYRAFLKSSLEEMFEIIGDVDGLFLDIVQVRESSNKYCRKGMRKQGLDPSNSIHRSEFYKKVMHEFKKEMTSFIHGMDKNVDIFYNSGHIGPYIRDYNDFYTHLELESLPSGGWGYMNFPITSRYARTLSKEILGMTGKFHTAWGDFHSFKNKAALEFEIFTNLAMGAKCSIGDQLQPDGKIDPATYELIGSVYKQVEAKEPWCDNIEPVVEIGLFTTEEYQGGSARNLPVEMMGATRMLQEGQHQFNIIDSKSKLDDYKLLILPDRIPMDYTFASKLRKYINNGGSVLATFESGLDKKQIDFVMDEWGVKKASDGPIDDQGELARGKFYFRNNFAEYIIPTGFIGKGLPETEHVMYIKGMDVKVTAKADVLANKVRSFFNRDYEHFCSHRQTPSSGKALSPAVVRTENVTYLSHPLFSQYYHNAPKWVKTITLNIIDYILDEPMVKIGGPSTLISTINDQNENNRYVFHLLHYIPEQRGKQFEIVEDVIPLYDLSVSLKLNKKISAVTLVPEGKELNAQVNKNRIEFVVPKLYGHQMVELTYIP